jgi:hypothetical protein
MNFKLILSLAFSFTSPVKQTLVAAIGVTQHNHVCTLLSFMTD